jgi:hypothetical protein
MNVVFRIVLVRLPYVMKQQRQQHQLGMLNFTEDHRKPMLRRQLFDVPDGDQRMFVNGVFVKKSRITRHRISSKSGKIFPSRPTSCIASSVS